MNRMMSDLAFLLLMGIFGAIAVWCGIMLMIVIPFRDWRAERHHAARLKREAKERKAKAQASAAP